MKTAIKLPVLSLLMVLISSSFLWAQQPKTKVTLGIKLDYFYRSKEGGVRAKGVVENKTAQKAGIQANDLIMAFNDRPIKGLFHYRDLLSEYTSGDKVKVKVKRKNEILYFNIQFE